MKLKHCFNIISPSSYYERWLAPHMQFLFAILFNIPSSFLSVAFLSESE